MWTQPPVEEVPPHWRQYGSHPRAAALARALQERHPVEPPLFWYIDFDKVRNEYSPSGIQIDVWLCRPNWLGCRRGVRWANATDVLSDGKLLELLEAPVALQQKIDTAAGLILRDHERDTRLATLLNSEDLDR